MLQVQEQDLTNVKVGDILYTEWGYECTIVEFYQVVRTTAKSFWIKKISEKFTPAKFGNAYMNIVTPNKNDFTKDIKFGTKAARKLKQDGVWLDRDQARGFLYKWHKEDELWDDRGQA